MAQWLGQYTGNTHATRVADVEEALRHAVAAFANTTAPADRRKLSRSILALAKRVLSARVRYLKARLAAAEGAGMEEAVTARAKEIAGLHESLNSAERTGVEGILHEFAGARVLRSIRRLTQR